MVEKFLTFVFGICAKIEWTGIAQKIYGRPFALKTFDWYQIASTLKDDNYYIILTRRSTHLTTYLIQLGNLLKLGKLGYWSHALMNVEEDLLPSRGTLMTSKFLEDVFKFVEATAIGVHYSTFFEVFNCDGVCLIRLPQKLTDKISKEIKEDIGKPYDNLFRYLDETKVSCAELIYDLITDEDDDIIKLCPHLYTMIQKARNITPEMYYEAALRGDFEIALEIRRKL